MLSFRDSPKFFLLLEPNSASHLAITLGADHVTLYPTASGPSVSQHFLRQPWGGGVDKRLWLWGIGATGLRDGSVSAGLLAHCLDWTHFTKSWASPANIKIKCLFHTDRFMNVFFYF